MSTSDSKFISMADACVVPYWREYFKKLDLDPSIFDPTMTASAKQ